MKVKIILTIALPMLLLGCSKAPKTKSSAPSQNIVSNRPSDANIAATTSEAKRMLVAEDTDSKQKLVGTWVFSATNTLGNQSTRTITGYSGNFVATKAAAFS